MTLVWISPWEFQCCGTDFKLGDHVEWTTEPVDPLDWHGTWKWLLRQLPRLDGQYSAHLDSDSGVLTGQVSGFVREIQGVWFEWLYKDSGAMTGPDPDQGVTIKPLKICTGQETRCDGQEICAYIVTVETDDISQDS